LYGKERGGRKKTSIFCHREIGNVAKKTGVGGGKEKEGSGGRNTTAHLPITIEDQFKKLPSPGSEQKVRKWKKIHLPLSRYRERMGAPSKSEDTSKGHRGEERGKNRGSTLDTSSNFLENAIPYPTLVAVMKKHKRQQGGCQRIYSSTSGRRRSRGSLL